MIEEGVYYNTENGLSRFYYGQGKWEGWILKKYRDGVTVYAPLNKDEPIPPSWWEAEDFVMDLLGECPEKVYKDVAIINDELMWELYFTWDY